MSDYRYVSRGGVKLEAAIKGFKLNVKGKLCADAGSSHGGFTEALLRFGAKKVYSIERGKGLLDWKLRQDPRVVVMEGVNVLKLPLLPEKVDLVTIDTSWTKLELVLPMVKGWLGSKSLTLALFKPQYEVKDRWKLRRGVVVSDKLRQQTLQDFINWAETAGWRLKGRIESPITGGAQGKKGNIEYLILLELEP